MKRQILYAAGLWLDDEDDWEIGIQSADIARAIDEVKTGEGWALPANKKLALLKITIEPLALPAAEQDHSYPKSTEEAE